MFRLYAVAIGVVAAAALGVAGVFFAPAALGGATTYAITQGSSMAPEFRGGDLVVIRRTSRVEVGEIAAYRSGLTGQVVVHRIIAKENGTFVFQGDNNSWIDTYQPTEDEIVGTLWLHLHGVGPVLNKVRSPWTAGIIGGFLAMTVASTPTERRSGGREDGDRRQLERTTSGSRGLVGTPGQALLASLIVLTLLLGGIAMISFRSPPTAAVEVHTPFKETAVFGYDGTARSGPVYLDERLETGDPIYVHLVPTMTYTFAYDLDAPGATDVHGTVRYFIDVRDINGWQRTFELQGTTEFAGTRTSVAAPIDLAALMEQARIIQAETGAPGRYWTAAVVADIQVEGLLDGQPFTSAFKPYYTLKINPPDEIYLETAATRTFDDLSAAPGTTESDPFHHSQEFEVTTNHLIPASFDMVFGRISVARLRVMTVTAAMLGLIASVMLGAFIVMALVKSQANRLYARYGGSLVHVDNMHLPPNENRIRMSSMDDLVRVANRLQTVVLWIHHEDADSYAVRDGERAYVFHVKAKGQAEAAS